MARRILITRRDWMQHDDAAFDDTVGVWSLPKTNMLDRLRPQVVAEAADNRDWSSTKFKFNLGSQRKVGMIAFANLRSTSMGLIQVKLSLNADMSSPTYDSGVTTTWPQDSVAGENNAWDEWTLNGVYLADEYAKLGYPRIFLPTAPVNCIYGLVEIRDSTASAPLQVGGFGVWETWEPPINLSYGWQLTPLDESELERARMGSTYVDEGPSRRRLNFGFPLLPQSEAWARAFGLVLVKGKSEPLWAVPFSDAGEVTRFEKAAVYGLISADSPLSNPFFQRYALPFQVEQLP